MKYNLDKKLIGIDGEIIKNRDDVEITIGDVIIGALMTTQHAEEMTREQKLKLGKLALRLQSEKEVDINIEEANIINERVAKFGTVLDTLRVDEFLESANK